MSRVQAFAPVASRLVLVCRTTARDLGGLRPDFSVPVSDWVRLSLFNGVSQCGATLRD